jgi:hypothetical protein
VVAEEEAVVVVAEEKQTLFRVDRAAATDSAVAGSAKVKIHRVALAEAEEAEEAEVAEAEAG